ncbi:MAG: hypothetical protein IJR58_01355 [Lachnospiraceae bacterium]|nr:hypothetical protein [Lachnospiraceae bacterium]
MKKKVIIIAITICMLLSSCGTNMDRESHIGNSAEEKNDSTTDVSLFSDKENAEQFTAITEGDFSVVNVDDKQKEQMEDIYSLMIERGIASTWHYFDVTGDGVDELIWEDISPFDENFKTVIAVFKSTKSGVERLHWDVNNNSRYLFIGDNNLVSYDDVGSAYMYVGYSEKMFDDDNNMYSTHAICAYIIYSYEEMEDYEDMKKRFLEDGMDGEGAYYYYITYGQSGEIITDERITKDDFLDYFTGMTGKPMEDIDRYWFDVISHYD